MQTTQAVSRTWYALAILGVLSLCSCASIVDGGRRKVHIDSNPTGAQVTIFNKHGEKESVNTTPFLARLDRHSGYFRGEEYRLVFELAGYQSSEVTVKSTLNPWYIGNIAFGGLIGILIVDPVTGAMWTLKPNTVVAALEPVPVAVQTPSSPSALTEPKPESPPSEPLKTPPAPAEQPQLQLAPTEQPKAEPATNEPPSVLPSAPKE